MKYAKYISLALVIGLAYGVLAFGHSYRPYHNRYTEGDRYGRHGHYHFPRDGKKYRHQMTYQGQNDAFYVYGHRTTPLHSYVKQNNYIKVRYELRYGANVNVIDNHGDTALHLAVERNYYKIATILLGYDAAVDVSDDYGRTAIFGVTEYAKNTDAAMKMLKLLVGKGADINAKDHLGENLLHKLASNGDHELAEMIVEEFHANPDMINDKGEKPEMHKHD